MAEADRTTEEGETARAGEGGLVVRVQLRGLQPDPHPETASAERMKQGTKPSAATWPSVADWKLKQQPLV